MLVAETCFCNLNNSPVRFMRGRVELYEGSTLLTTFKHTDYLKSFNVERVGDSSKFYGFGVCHRLNVKVMDKERQFNITTANTLDIAFGVGCDFIYPFPLFKITEVRRDETTNELSITAYDYLYKAAELKVNSLDLPQTYTIKDFTNACAAALGVAVVIPAFDAFNTNYEAGANFDGTETIREALNAVAEATQTIYYLNNEMVLTFKRLDIEGAAVLTITKDNYFTLDSSTNKRLTAVAHATELGDNVEASLSISGTTQYIRDNPFWELREDIGALVDAALAAVGGLTINQFNCKWRGNYLLEVGDKIAIITKDNKTAVSYLLDDTITYDGSMYQETKWQYTENEAETATNPSNLGEALKTTYARVDKINKEINMLVSQTEANTANIAAIRLDTESINANVSRVETAANAALNGVNGDIATLTNKVNAAMTAEGVKLSIQEELANGVDKVYTSTGFSFDADGLRVSKSGSEMESLLDEDGLTVYRDDTEVLTADNTGVNGINMTVRQYLIVGGSRFESYGGRTGCFWLGG